MELLYSSEQIKEAIKNVACHLNNDYEGEKPVIIGVLNGSFIFLADLVRELEFDHQIDFCKVKSFDNNKRGNVTLEKKWSLNLFHRSVIIIEDIIDSGQTIEFLKEEIEKCFPQDIRVCTLLVRQNTNALVDYRCFILDDESYVVGLGLDDNQYKRNLNQIYKL